MTEDTRIHAGQGGGLVGVMLTIVVVGALAIIGAVVLDSIFDAVELTGNYQAAAGDLVGGFDDSISLLGIVFIVLILMVLLTVLLNLTRQR